jgi:hypothetical protein
MIEEYKGLSLRIHPFRLKRKGQDEGGKCMSRSRNISQRMAITGTSDLIDVIARIQETYGRLIHVSSPELYCNR